MEKKTSLLRELLNFGLIIVFIVLPIRLYVAQPFVVVGSSMEPTFINNNYLIIDELSYRLTEPKRGDVIVFKYAGNGEESNQGKFFIKRIIGLPGETVDIKNGVVTIINKENPEGIALDESYIKEKPTNILTVTLEPDRYFVMGDNRAVSFDSRSWGPLEKDEIVGKVFLRILPINKAEIFPGSHAGHYTNETK